MKVTFKKPCQACHSTGYQGQESCWDCRGTGEVKWKETLYLALFGPLHGKEIGQTEAHNNNYMGFNKASFYRMTPKIPKIWVHKDFKEHIKYSLQYVKNV